MNQWVRVEFYAQMPDGMAMVDARPDVTAQTLVDTFGYRHVEAVSTCVVADRGYRRSMLSDPEPVFIDGQVADAQWSPTTLPSVRDLRDFRK